MPRLLQPTALSVNSDDPFARAAFAVIDAKRSEHTRSAYRTDLRRWIGFCAELGIDPRSPSLADATAFRDQLRTLIAEDSARRTIAAMSSVYKTLLAGRAVRANPFHPSALAWPVANTIAKTQLVSDEDANAMIANAEKDRRPVGARDAAILTLLFDTGLRRASVAQVLRKNYRKPMLRTIVKGGEEVEVLLPDSSIAALDRWLQVAPESLYLFPGERGPINCATVNRLVNQRAKAVGAINVHPHSFRAAFATAGYDAGLPEFEIQRGMHHKDPSTTRRYDRGARGGMTATKIATFRNRK